MRNLRIPHFTCVLLIAASCESLAQADLVFDLTERGSGGVDVSGVGSGFMSEVLITSNFVLDGFDSDFLSDMVTTSARVANSVNGMLKNVTTGDEVAIHSLQFDRDSGSADDLRFASPSALTFALGDEFQFSLNATFSQSELSFAELIPGSHTHTRSSGLGTTAFGTTTVNVSAVPEASAALSLAAVACLGMFRRWR